jgi:hypothetical protein
VGREMFDSAIASKEGEIRGLIRKALVSSEDMYFDCVEYDSDAIRQSFSPPRSQAYSGGGSLLPTGA